MTANMQFAARELGLTTIVIGATHVKSVQIAYDPPQAIGADRFCGIATAMNHVMAPVIVVDLGTATVVEVVDHDRVYRGGIIAPGVATAAESLNQLAALLPKVDLAFPPSVIGTNTVQAIQSGILYGALAMIDGLVSAHPIRNRRCSGRRHGRICRPDPIRQQDNHPRGSASGIGRHQTVSDRRMVLILCFGFLLASASAIAAEIRLIYPRLEAGQDTFRYAEGLGFDLCSGSSGRFSAR